MRSVKKILFSWISFLYLWSGILEAESSYTLRILATSDIHGFLTDYDYYQGKSTDAYGLSRLLPVLKQLREQQPNSLWLDNGDIIQGSPITDWAFDQYQQKKLQSHPVTDIANMVGLDAMNLGNHEFNYGLDFLSYIMKQAKFPVINANVYTRTNKNTDYTVQLATDFVILERVLVSTDGVKQSIRIGITGVTPPQIMLWDAKHLKNKVICNDMVSETVKRVEKLKLLKADVVILLAHTGLGKEKPTTTKEDMAYELAKIKGIDAIIFGHSHLPFPDLKQTEILDGISMQKGLIGAVAAVNPSNWASYLGVIDMSLTFQNGVWTIQNKSARLEAIPKQDKNVKNPFEFSRSGYERVDKQLDYVHAQVKQFFDRSIGNTSQPIHTYFSTIMDTVAVEIVNKAQYDFIKPYIELSAYKHLPLLSVSAPFKAGNLKNSSDYSDIPVGQIKLKNVADLYKYANTLAVVKVTGTQLTEWLERSATIYNTIDPAKDSTQQLINNNFPSYNFDIIDGVTYSIRVDVPSRYDNEGKLQNPNSHRIQDLRYQGKPVDEKAEFLVVTNNYRAGGGGTFPSVDGKNTVIQLQETNRDAVAEYLKRNGVNQPVDGNWKLIVPKTLKPIEFLSSPKAKAFVPAFLETQELLESGNLRFTFRSL